MTSKLFLSTRFARQHPHDALYIICDGIYRRHRDVVELEPFWNALDDIVHRAASRECAVGIVVDLADARRNRGVAVAVHEAGAAMHNERKPVRRLADAFDHVD